MNLKMLKAYVDIMMQVYPDGDLPVLIRDSSSGITLNCSSLGQSTVSHHEDAGPILDLEEGTEYIEIYGD